MCAARSDLLKKEWEILKSLSKCIFLRAPSSGFCSDVITSEVCLQNSGTGSAELIRMGAVYVQSLKDCKPRRILSDTHVSAGDLIRVHPFPRRYGEIDRIDWQKVLVHDTEDYLIINKPAGLPSNPMLDNFYENVFEGARTALNRGEELFLPHRLDTDTSGLLLLGKKKEFTTHFGNLLSRRHRVVKKYRAIIASNSSLTLEDIRSRLTTLNNIPSLCSEDSKKSKISTVLTCYQEKNSRSPKIFSEHQTENSLDCQLVLSSTTYPITRTIHDWKEWLNALSSDQYDSATMRKFREGMSCWLDMTISRERPQLRKEMKQSFDELYKPIEDMSVVRDDKKTDLTLWEVNVELLTGRTHQCRGQLQTLGPGIHIAGDNMYPGATTLMRPDGYRSSSHLALQSYHLSFHLPSKHVSNKEHSSSLSEPSIVTYELDNSWWQPLSDLLEQNSSTIDKKLS